ncbi:Fe-S cluster assembly protein SufD [Baaleninema simplex]|uniref:Fe-S cluster assembly protein SufD n=1 Tax=Baaleninema simplex TaxID=2862350 RepID=UPI00034A3147|nr:Fe-S cluster assembly protein SufD [Baaleninema simplex]
MSPETITKQQVSSLTQLLNLREPLATEVTALKTLRDRSEAWVRELAIPTTRDEEWRFTDLSPLLNVEFNTAPSVDVKQSRIETCLLPEAPQSRLVFVNGAYTESLSDVRALPEGVWAGNVSALPPEKQEQLGDYLARHPNHGEVFTALNSASFTDLAIVWVPRGKIVETPLQLMFVASPTDKAMLTQPRCLVVAESNSSLTLVEEYIATTEGCPDSQGVAYFNNAVTEVWLHENADVNHVRLERDNGSAFHIGTTAVTQARDSRYRFHALTLGAQLSRHNIEVHQIGEGTTTTLNGLTLIGKTQTADTHSTVAYNYPNGTANQLHKCIVGDKAHAVFNGRIVVPQAAQMTNASQLNRNLLLSPKARVNTKPQLEIVADNVKCSHGATVSQLEADEVFYLQSRGLDKTTSENLLVDAFAAEILQEVPLESLRKAIAQCVACRVEL